MKLNKLSITIVVLALSACGILPQPKPVRVYQLPASEIGVNVPRKDLSLYIDHPYANRFLDHHRLAVVLASHEVQSYAGIRWEDTLPIMYRDRLVDDFRRTHAYQTVVSSDNQVIVDRILKLEIQDYQLQYKGKQLYVVININASLIKASDLSILASANFKQASQVSSAELDTIMPVFATLTGNINADIIRWAAEK